MKAEILRRVLEDVVRHAAAAAPDECCGMLIGRGDRIEEAVSARNISDRPATRFLIEPRDHVAALRAARSRGLDVVGFYHSHPRTAADPSQTDVAESGYPGYWFLIVGLGPDPVDIRLFQFEEGNFLQVPFVTVA